MAVISTLADTCGGATIWGSAPEPGSRVATVDLCVDYLLPGALEDLACEGPVLRIGNRLGVTELRVFGAADADVLIAVGNGVYKVWRSKPPA